MKKLSVHPATIEDEETKTDFIVRSLKQFADSQTDIDENFDDILGLIYQIYITKN